jgi:hypothetical protein
LRYVFVNHICSFKDDFYSNNHRWFSNDVKRIVPLVKSAFGQKDDNPMKEVDRLTADGRWQEALEKHIWFHNHILEKNPSYYGVRLSFALSRWVELGQKYPKALAALTEIRDSKTERLLKGEHDRELFHDVMAINRYLKQSSATVDLFKRLEKTSPKFAVDIYSMADESLLEAQEYSLARKYMGDPIARLESAQQNLQEGLARAKSMPSGDAARRASECIFIDEVVGLIAILKNTSEAPLAKHVQTEALKTLENSQIKDAL